MNVSLGDDDGLQLSSSEPQLAVGQQAIVLRLTLGETQSLDEATVRLVRVPDVAVAPTVITTDQLSSDGPAALLSNVTWLSADWSETLALDRFTLSFTAKPNPLTVRLSVARGQSSWYPPPGPQSFVMAGALTLNGAFPNTVADRLMLEFFAADESPATVSLTGPSPLSMVFGQHARDISVALQGRRSFFRGSGEAPTGDGLVIGGLLEHLRQELGDDLRGQDIALELRADVAGDVALEWAFTTSEIAEQFEGGADEAALEVAWGGTAAELVPLPPETQSEVLEISLRASSVPVRERVVHAPVTSPPPTSNGQLARPLYDVAQSLSVVDPRPLVSIDLYARALGSGVSTRLGLHTDVDGRPAATPIIEVARELAATSADEADWISFPLAEPQALPDAPYWIVLTVDEGELSWFVEDLGAEPTDELGDMVFRRDGGLWLSRNGANETLAAMTRLRVLDDTPPSPPTLELVGFTSAPTSPDQVPDFVAPIPLDDDGRAHWTADDPAAPPTLATASLRVSSTVASTVTLSDLELRYRVPSGV